jgi:translation initiation factor IF-2
MAMRHIIGTVFAVSLAGVAAIAATTAYLNSPLRIGPATTNTPAPAPGQAPAPEAPVESTPAPAGGAKPASPADIPEAPPPGGASAPAPGAAAPGAEGTNPDEPDKDPYEGIAPEDLPPDLQYNADSSVSFPTNI